MTSTIEPFVVLPGEGREAAPPGAPDAGTYREIAHSAWMEVVGPPMAQGEGD